MEKEFETNEVALTDEIIFEDANVSASIMVITCEENKQEYITFVDYKNKMSKMIKKDDLVIAADFHNPDHCNAPITLEKANKVILIDHHRRSTEFIENHSLIYLEPYASSTCEIVAKFLFYINADIDEDDLELIIEKNKKYYNAFDLICQELLLIFQA